MFTLKNTSVTSNWYVDLSDYPEVENFLPYNAFNIRNDSSQIAYVDLGGRKVGEVQRYSTDSFNGRGFSSFRVYNPAGANFAVDDLFVQVAKDQVMTSQPFNPQWDMMEEDLDRFVTGCNARVSLSSTLTALLIKYWLNVQNSIIVQRKLDVLGGASVGSYEIDFSGDIIRGSTPIDFPMVEPKRYKKTISNSGLSYTLSNCTIQGWVVDYFKNPNDISKDYTLTAGGASGPNAYDDDLTTFAGNYSAGYSAVVTHWEVSFTARNIKEIHALLSLQAFGDPGYTGRIYFQVYTDGAWVTISSHLVEGANTTVWKYVHNTTGYTNVTGFRLYSNNDNNANSSGKIYDVSVFE